MMKQLSIYFFAVLLLVTSGCALHPSALFGAGEDMDDIEGERSYCKDPQLATASSSSLDGTPTHDILQVISDIDEGFDYIDITLHNQGSQDSHWLFVDAEFMTANGKSVSIPCKKKEDPVDNLVDYKCDLSKSASGDYSLAKISLNGKQSHGVYSVSPICRAVYRNSRMYTKFNGETIFPIWKSR